MNRALWIGGIRNVLAGGRREVSQQWGMLVAFGVLALVGMVLCFLVIWPAYRDPIGRMYTSGLGYGSLKRSMGTAFEVEESVAKSQKVSVPYLGEGVVSGNPVRVSVIPTALVTKVHVEVGDRVQAGDILMELDDAEAQRNVASAELGLKTAESELERVRIGSAYVLAQERPELDQIELEGAQEDAALLAKKLASHRRLLQRGLIAETDVLEIERAHAEAQKTLREAEFFSGMSTKGAGFSNQIAENALADAQQNLAFRKSELENFSVHAPVEGLVSQVLVREGEFNQDFGKPAFILTTGMWFEGYFDQSVLPVVKEGQTAEIFLEAFPGKSWEAVVDKVIPEISFASGGPEISRPLRPRGTGTPEWAATFRVRFRFAGEAPQIALGMTGNVRLVAERESLVVPRNAVLSVSAGRGLLLIPEDEGWEVRPVEVGHVSAESIEILGGLEAGEKVFSKGHRILREGDSVEIVSPES